MDKLQVVLGYRRLKGQTDKTSFIKDIHNWNERWVACM